MKCSTCAGCGKVADTEAREPWSDWLKLPFASALAVRLGLVKPIECSDCKGIGSLPEVKESMPALRIFECHICETKTEPFPIPEALKLGWFSSLPVGADGMTITAICPNCIAKMRSKPSKAEP